MAKEIYSVNTVANTLCRRKSTHYMKIPLKSTEQIYLIFLIPTLINCFIYIIHFAADLVVAIQHFKEENPLWGICTVAIIYLPALMYFILTVSRPDWWMTEDDKISKGIVGWFALQMCQFIGFVFFVLYRFAGLIVLSVDAINLSGDERLKTLNIAAVPAAIELYFFLQAWFQAAPQAVFQAHLLFRESSVPRSYQSMTVQILCIIMSIIIVAIKTASFQRFESQRVNGRKLPWAMWLKKYCIQEINNIEEKVPLQTLPLPVKKQEDTMNAPAKSTAPEENTVTENEQEQEHQTQSHAALLDRQVSMTPPLPPKNAHVTPPPTPLRGITTVAPLPVPDIPAPPRPDSVYTEEETAKAAGIIESDQRLTDSSEQSLKVPKRKYSKKGLEEDDPMGKFLSFLWWFFFILARVFAIAVAYEFYPLTVVTMICVHYVIMLAYLFYYSKYYDIITLVVNLWLGLVYIFSLIEYRIKFKYADWCTLPYYVFVIVQNVAFTFAWYMNADWNGFWYTYIFWAILGSMVLCVLSSAVYHVMFKPKKRRVYSS
ncbi:XKR7 protein, partial [Pseudoatta argentina]